MPDLNSLPPSGSPDLSSPRPVRIVNTNDPLASRMTPPSPHAASVSSLAQAATINASIQQGADSQRSSPSSGRNALGGSPQSHRSTARASRGSSVVAMNLNLNDPALPAPGEMQGAGSSSSYGGGSALPGVSGGSGSRRGSQHSISAAVYRSPSLGGVSLTNSPRSPGGIMGDPHHQRAPSLGELHQELEQEQEAQVNRLLQLIRQQQAQLHALQSQVGGQPASDVAEPASSTSDRSASYTAPPSAALPLSSSTTGAASTLPASTPYPPFAPFAAAITSSSVPRTRSPHPRDHLSRQSSYRSRRSSRDSPGLAAAAANTNVGGTGSSGTLPSILPSLVALPSLEDPSSRDEVAFYQAETQNLTRENQMLRVRLRELERQVGDMQHGNRHGGGGLSSVPASTSNLAAAPAESASDGDGKEGDAATMETSQGTA